MRTATVRDLRNNFGSLAKWIEWGEAVTITRHGRNFATLTPAGGKTRSKEERRAAWAERAKKFKPVGRPLSKKETEAFWSRLRD